MKHLTFSALLLVATSGAAFAQASSTPAVAPKETNPAAPVAGANSFTENNRSEDGWGWTMGGGVEAKVSDNFSIGARYLWTRYNVDDYRVDVGAGSAPATNPFLITPSGGTSINRGDKFDTQSVMVTTSFRF